jgi:choline dehydrogenase-like flavoprotein
MTPHILLHSGIGPKDELEALGIQAIVDHPDVGKNLTDHPLVSNIWQVSNNNTRDDYPRDPALVQRLTEEWLNNGTGEYLVTTPLQQNGFLRLKEDSPAYSIGGDPSSGPDAPHIQFLTHVRVTFTLR